MGGTNMNLTVVIPCKKHNKKSMVTRAK